MFFYRLDIDTDTLTSYTGYGGVYNIFIIRMNGNLDCLLFYFACPINKYDEFRYVSFLIPAKSVNR